MPPLWCTRWGAEDTNHFLQYVVSLPGLRLWDFFFPRKALQDNMKRIKQNEWGKDAPIFSFWLDTGSWTRWLLFYARLFLSFCGYLKAACKLVFGYLGMTFPLSRSNIPWTLCVWMSYRCRSMCLGHWWCVWLPLSWQNDAPMGGKWENWEFIGKFEVF